MNFRISSKKLIISDLIAFPIDEGYKKFTYNFYKYCLTNINDVRILSSPSNLDNEKIKTFPLSKLFLSKTLFFEIKKYDPDMIIYIPAASTTFFSFFRCFVLNCISPKTNIIMVSIQKRKHNIFTKLFIRIGNFNIITFSKSANNLYANLSVRTKFLPLGVDQKLFIKSNTSLKNDLRKKYGFNSVDKIVLHVGHINKSRNIQMLSCLLSIGYHVVVVGSSSTIQDKELCFKMRESGIIIFDKYIENIQEIYQLSDFYVFPVLNEESAIEFPLSILEAMSCNLPILTTRFGGLVDYFSESNYFKYFNSEDELINKIKKIKNIFLCDNRDIIEKSFTWNNIFSNILS
ncbi:MAG TPA: glycosyltransferase [Candidatus Paceibacterota bacterium]